MRGIVTADDGTIFITINEAKDPEGLQTDLRERLQALGDPAAVDGIHA